ncbi:hypothetical protein A6A07_30150 [Streptomyces sp. CB03911]|nr:hypothetical protein A6A07_30150 [Streptomyces sp. CB03911]
MEENRLRARELLRAAEKGDVYGAFNAAAPQRKTGGAADRGECIRPLNQAANGGVVAAAATPGDTLAADGRDEEALGW